MREGRHVAVRGLFWIAWALVWFLARNLAASDVPVVADWVLEGGLVLDGTGAPGQVADLAIQGDRIVAVGKFQADRRARRIDVRDRIVAPGFIDLHTHSDELLLAPRTRANRNYLAQGVTTVVTGNCGVGPADVGAFLSRLDRERPGTNVLHLIPQGEVRRAVMGTSDRKASAAELRRMEAIVARGMKAGAWGMSAGLIYVPSRYADTAELIALAKVVARWGGLYACHMRDEGDGLLTALDEVIRIGRAAGLPVHVSHLKASGRANWGQVVPACAKLAAARAEGLRVTADQYPYTASGMTLAAMVVPEWARRGTAADFARLRATRWRVHACGKRSRPSWPGATVARPFAWLSVRPVKSVWAKTCWPSPARKEARRWTWCSTSRVTAAPWRSTFVSARTM